MSLTETNKPPAPLKEAETITTWNFVFPNDANPYGTMFGGQLLAIMDTTAALAAIRFAETTVSTVSVEAVHFKKPIVVGDRIRTDARVVLAGSTSLTVRTDVFRDVGDNQVEHCVTAHFVLVAFDANRVPTAVPSLQLTDKDRHWNEQAQVVRSQAKVRDQAISNFTEDGQSNR